MKSIGQVSGKQMAWIGGWLAAAGLVILVPWRVTAQTGGESASSAAAQAESQSRLKQLGRALIFYAQDYDELLPPMTSPLAVKKVLSPYVRKNDAVFLDPRTNEPYQPNASLSGKRVATVTRRGIVKRAEITHLANVVALYELTPAANGERDVLFLDGHVQRVSGAEWQRLKQASRLP